MRALRRSLSALAAACALAGGLAGPTVVAAHPLGNFTVNRAVIVEVGTDVRIRYLVDMAEIPAFEAIRDIDVDEDGVPAATEVAAYAGAACDAARDGLVTSVDDGTAPLAASSPPTISFPPGAGGLETLRLECSFAVDLALATGDDHRLRIRDTSDDGRIGWREVVVRATDGATITASDAPDTSPSDELRAYPDASLQTPPDTRAATVDFRLDSQPAAEPPVAAPTEVIADRETAADPLAALVGGELSPPVVLLALAVALGLGAAHAVSPGHGKTLVASYVLGAGGDAWSAMRIGLWVAVAHTGGVFALGVVTLAAGQFLLPERAIAWLSLASAVVVAGLGISLVVRRWPRAVPAAQSHSHGRGRPHDHGHSHEPAPGGLTWRSAVALGFAGGAVPSASAVVVLLVAITSDRLAFGTLLIGAFGIGMAVVLGGLGLVTARVGAVARRADNPWLTAPLVRRIGAWVPSVAGVAVLVTGLVFAATAAASLG